MRATNNLTNETVNFRAANNEEKINFKMASDEEKIMVAEMWNEFVSSKTPPKTENFIKMIATIVTNDDLYKTFMEGAK